MSVKLKLKIVQPFNRLRATFGGNGSPAYFSIFLAIILVILVIFLFFTIDRDSKIDLKDFKLDVVTTDLDRQKGLGGRDLINQNEGMLFDFSDNSDGRCIWMKDMRFAIDVVWLNKELNIIKLAKNISPASFPASYCSDQKPYYVLELPTKTIDSLKMSVNSQVSLPEDI